MPDAYLLEYSEKAATTLKKLDKTIVSRLREKLEYLATHTDEMKHLALTGNLSGMYKLRMGDYRMLYTLDRENRIITVETIGHRRDVYD